MAASGRGSDCIWQGSIRDYRVLDNSNMIVRAGGSQRYHVMLVRPVFGLRSAHQIAFQSRTGRVCEGFSDLVISDGFDSSVGDAERIRIHAIQQLTPEQEEELLVRFGIKEPAVQKPREPEKVEGAEVEELD